MMAKKKSTSKSKKKEAQIKEPKVLTLEEKQATADKLNKLKGSEVMILPDDAVVTIPISGQFNKALEGLFFHLMEPLNASEIIHVMDNIKQNFNNYSDNFNIDVDLIYFIDDSNKDKNYINNITKNVYLLNKIIILVKQAE